MGKSFETALHRLASWFERQKRILPWREDPSLYRVWVSEIMLQQTQVTAVIPYFERFVARFPSVSALAAAPEEEVLLHWAGLGYYSRARNLHRAAKQLADQGFPRDREGWLKIPGVGDYTAGAILSIALDQPEPILDGNVERVLSRLRRVGREKGDAAYKARLWRLSRAFVTRGHQKGLSPNVVNQALMELGAMICTPRSPSCLICPIAGICKGRGEAASYPPKRKAKAWIEMREELHCWIDDEGRLLLRQRAAGEWRAGLWDLLEREPEGARFLGEIVTKHVVTNHRITRRTKLWRSTGWAAREPRGAEGKAHRWISATAPEVAVGSALKRTLSEIRAKFPGALR